MIRFTMPSQQQQQERETHCTRPEMFILHGRLNRLSCIHAIRLFLLLFSPLKSPISHTHQVPNASHCIVFQLFSILSSGGSDTDYPISVDVPLSQPITYQFRHLYLSFQTPFPIHCVYHLNLTDFRSCGSLCVYFISLTHSRSLFVDALSLTSKRNLFLITLSSRKVMSVDQYLSFCLRHIS